MQRYSFVPEVTCAIKPFLNDDSLPRTDAHSLLLANLIHLIPVAYRIVILHCPRFPHSKHCRQPFR